MTTLSVVAGENVARLEEVKQEVSTFSIGTRKSKLAVIQSETVVKDLAAIWPDYRFDIKARDTAAGDIDKVTPFKDMPVKNLWTHELETLMVEGNLDFLVHCLKGKIYSSNPCRYSCM
jgi:hydroxymethylbilane synthase